MFPDSHCGPVGLFEMVKGLVVSFLVALDLLNPECRVPSRQNAVLGASVPETSVHEDCDLRRPKDDIRASVEIGERPSVNAIPESSFEQRRAQGQFGLGVATRVAPHRGSCGGAGRP